MVGCMGVICGMKDIEGKRIMKGVMGGGVDKDRKEKYERVVN